MAEYGGCGSSVEGCVCVLSYRGGERDVKRM